MSDTTIAESRMGRHELGNRWHSKGLFWSLLVVTGMAQIASLGLINSSVADAYWSGVLMGVQCSLLAAQIGAFTHMCVCCRRAAKIWKGEVAA